MCLEQVIGMKKIQSCLQIFHQLILFCLPGEAEICNLALELDQELGQVIIKLKYKSNVLI